MGKVTHHNTRKTTSKAQPFKIPYASNLRKAVSGVDQRSQNDPFPSTRVRASAPDGSTGGKGSNYRSNATIRRLAMYKRKPNLAKMKVLALQPARIAPDRRWFTNTRLITQEKLSEFREAMQKASSDPYSVVLKRSKLPISLFTDGSSGSEDKNQARMKLLGIESYGDTFGPKARRKKPNLQVVELNELKAGAEQKSAVYGEGENDKMMHSTLTEAEPRECATAEIFKKGASRRIWQELYKVIDSSDILVQVIDARDPMGTRCKSLEKYLKKDKPFKHFVLLFNKCDLIPSWATARWVKILSKEFPTVAFHASMTNPFGKQALISLLRQYATLLKERQHVSVGFIGYPNVGKSSVINTLRKKKVCSSAPTPGQTRIWQFVSLTSRVHLIDCPGIVPSDEDVRSEGMKIMRGAIRAERVEAPEEYMDEILANVKKEAIKKRYKMPDSTEWENAEELLTILAKKMGKLRKGGEPEIQIAARIMIYDLQRGRIPYFVPPPYAHTMTVDQTVIKSDVISDVVDKECCEETKDEIEADVETMQPNAAK